MSGELYVSMMKFRASPGEYVNLVLYQGKEIILTKNGKQVAKLVPIEPTAAELGAEVRRLGLAGS